MSWWMCSLFRWNFKAQVRVIAWEENDFCLGWMITVSGYSEKEGKWWVYIALRNATIFSIVILYAS